MYDPSNSEGKWHSIGFQETWYQKYETVASLSCFPNTSSSTIIMHLCNPDTFPAPSWHSLLFQYAGLQPAYWQSIECARKSFGQVRATKLIGSLWSEVVMIHAILLAIISGALIWVHGNVGALALLSHNNYVLEGSLFSHGDEGMFALLSCNLTGIDSCNDLVLGGSLFGCMLMWVHLHKRCKCTAIDGHDDVDVFAPLSGHWQTGSDAALWVGFFLFDSDESVIPWLSYPLPSTLSRHSECLSPQPSPMTHSALPNCTCKL
ncbi:hypothetical protein OG21DRAFT_1527172 [Imleria badia]|nr:hypothetical protein OG21DRAFT_1527172 [Imleria badia]